MTIINNFEFSRKEVNMYAWIDNIFTDDELTDLIIYGNKLNFDNGKVGSKEDGRVDEQYRDSKVKFIYLDQNASWIFNKLNNAIDYANNTFFQFDLIGYDYFQYTQYNKDQYYKAHVDMHFGMTDNVTYNAFSRKLSLSLLLNDNFEGGDLVLYQDTENPFTLEKKKGRCYFFPSFLMHQVTTVTSGVRNSLVVWVMGPRWK
jgi:PKHD-type hydroxylase